MYNFFLDPHKMKKGILIDLDAISRKEIQFGYEDFITLPIPYLMHSTIHPPLNYL